MTDPRSVALPWLANLLVKHCPGCTVDDNAPSGMGHIRQDEAQHLAEAIIADAVVEWRKLRLGPGRYDPRQAQPVIRVPGAYPKPGEEC